jgi:hypothetical protein
LASVRSSSQRDLLQTLPCIGPRVWLGAYKTSDGSSYVWLPHSATGPATVLQSVYGKDMTEGSGGVYGSGLKVAPSTFTNWDFGQPDNWRGSQSCMSMGIGRWDLWDDDDCANAYKFIIEYDLGT